MKLNLVAVEGNTIASLLAKMCRSFNENSKNSRISELPNLDLLVRGPAEEVITMNAQTPDRTSVADKRPLALENLLRVVS